MPELSRDKKASSAGFHTGKTNGMLAYLLTTAVAPTVLPQDIDRLVGIAWKGTLTYRDYTSDKSVTIPSTLRVTGSKDKPRTWEWATGYTDEPQANQSTPFLLSEDGRTLDGEAVLLRKAMKDGMLKIMTQVQGEDNNKPAQIRHIYLIDSKQFSLQKLVKFADSKAFFERHIYRHAKTKAF